MNYAPKATRENKGQEGVAMLDIDRWLISFSFTDKLVSKIMRASWGFPVIPPGRILSM